jgi:16S rRNA (cytidine1402-2'-O)-methyltransferase
MATTGTLYIVPTPIGNLKDITLRAIETLQQVDAVICEEARTGSTLLKRLNITPKELLSLNEHNEAEQAEQLAIRMLQGQSMALISDCGTPVFSDPGHQLVKCASDYSIRVVPLPGPSSLMAALSVLNFKIEKFVFGGFLARQPDLRRKELQRLRDLRTTVVLMDAPYRLAALLEDIAKIFGKGCQVTLVCDISLPSEKIFRGSVSEVQSQAGQRKAEFILIIH